MKAARRKLSTFFALLIYGSSCKQIVTAFISNPRRRTFHRISSCVDQQNPEPRLYSNNSEVKAKNDKSSEEVVLIENLAQEQIAELIEVTFINACMQLAQGYVDVLKLFIVAVKSSYERGSITVQELIDAVEVCPIETAGRPLSPEEVDLRTTWILAVYCMLDHINHSSGSPLKVKEDESAGSVLGDIPIVYGPVLPDLVALQSEGGKFTTKAFVEAHTDSLPQSIQKDEIQMAVVSQTIKVMWYTLVVLEEEKLANDEYIPRPNIPRGSGKN